MVCASVGVIGNVSTPLRLAKSRPSGGCSLAQRLRALESPSVTAPQTAICNTAAQKAPLFQAVLSLSVCFLDYNFTLCYTDTKESEVMVMKNLFPTMRDCPDGRQIAAGGLYWFVYQIALPFFIVLTVISLAFPDGTSIFAYVAYCVINLICVLLIFRTYLKESFWSVRLYTKRFLISTGLGVAVFSALELLMMLAGTIAGDSLLLTCVPVTEYFLGFGDPEWVMAMPIGLALLLFLIVPISHCCLYYAVGFALPCQKRPWLGYLIVAGLSVIPAVLMVTAVGCTPVDALVHFLSMLPFHMCACWVYQRSDTIWGPIAFYAGVNLLWSPVMKMLLPNVIIVYFG